MEQKRKEKDLMDTENSVVIVGGRRVGRGGREYRGMNVNGKN